jgi:hypothetical protein
MSFFSSGRRDGCPGPIQGSPLNGLCERVCILTKKVYDSCIKTFRVTDVQVTATNFDPPLPVQPLTFVGCSGETNDAEIQDLVIDRFVECPNFGRVTANVLVPITITYTDANAVPGTADGIITIPIDLILFLPQPSIVPFTIEAFTRSICSDGEYIGNNIFEIDACVSIIIRVVAKVQLLIPSYGYCCIPECQDYPEDACPGLSNLPLYPI